MNTCLHNFRLFYELLFLIHDVIFWFARFDGHRDFFTQQIASENFAKVATTQAIVYTNFTVREGVFVARFEGGAYWVDENHTRAGLNYGSVLVMMIDQLWDCGCLLYTSPSPRDATLSRMPSSA